MHNQRQWRRLGRAAVRVDKIAGKRVRVEVHDLSLGGICLSAPIRVEKGDALELVLAEPLSASPRQLRARVRWVRGSLIGLAWIGLTSEQHEWMCALFRFWLGAVEVAGP